jgi:hypothetical protein
MSEVTRWHGETQQSPSRSHAGLSTVEPISSDGAPYHRLPHQSVVRRRHPAEAPATARRKATAGQRPRYPPRPLYIVLLLLQPLAMPCFSSTRVARAPVPLQSLRLGASGPSKTWRALLRLRLAALMPATYRTLLLLLSPSSTCLPYRHAIKPTRSRGPIDGRVLLREGLLLADSGKKGLARRTRAAAAAAAGPRRTDADLHTPSPV